MIRAEQTLDVIYGDVQRKAIKNLSEMSFGRWECKTFDELKLEPEFDEWMNCTDNSFVFPEGDSILSFYERVEKGFDELLGLHRLKELSHRHSGKDATSVIVCHGGVISACMERYFSGDREQHDLLFLRVYVLQCITSDLYCRSSVCDCSNRRKVRGQR